MGRIGDSSDEQRIREMNEAQFRKKADNEKKSDQERRAKAFNEVMGTKQRQEAARRDGKKQASAKQAEQQGQKTQQPAVRRALGQKPQSPAELARRAAMAKAARGGMLKTRNVDIGKGKKAEFERVADIDVGSEGDREKVDKGVRSDERAEEMRDAQKNEEVIELNVDPDAQGDRRQHQERREREGKGSDQRDGAQGVAGTGGPRAAHQVKLPTAVLEAIAKAVALAFAADGKTEMHIALKGDMLEGVTLKVSARKGKVRCSFEGCDRNTKNLIESSRGELMRQLGKRGMELDILRVR